ncbi:MAG: hypothetical protein WDW36_004700 [Sanguina aurantia]
MRGISNAGRESRGLPGDYGNSYGKKKALTVTPVRVALIASLLCSCILVWAYLSTRHHAHHLGEHKSNLQEHIISLRAEMAQLTDRLNGRAQELHALEGSFSHVQRKLHDTSSELHRKTADAANKEETILFHHARHDVLRERLEGREAELTKLVEDKQTELEIHHMAEEELRRQVRESEALAAAMTQKMTHMEEAHKAREGDWHTLAGQWIKHERDLQEMRHKGSSTEPQNDTVATPEDSAPIPEPLSRAETKFEDDTPLPERRAADLAAAAAVNHVIDGRPVDQTHMAAIHRAAVAAAQAGLAATRAKADELAKNPSGQGAAAGGGGGGGVGGGAGGLKKEEEGGHDAGYQGRDHGHYDNLDQPWLYDGLGSEEHGHYHDDHDRTAAAAAARPALTAAQRPQQQQQHWEGNPQQQQQQQQQQQGNAPHGGMHGAGSGGHHQQQHNAPSPPPPQPQGHGHDHKPDHLGGSLGWKMGGM